MLDWRSGWDKLPWHSTTCETALVYESAMGIICIVHYVRLMGFNHVAWIYGQLAGEVYWCSNDL